MRQQACLGSMLLYQGQNSNLQFLKANLIEKNLKRTISGFESPGYQKGIAFLRSNSVMKVQSQCFGGNFRARNLEIFLLCQLKVKYVLSRYWLWDFKPGIQKYSEVQGRPPCPFILILSRFYHNFIQILLIFYLTFIHILSILYPSE